MSLSRRFQNLIAENRFTGVKSLFSVDLTRQLFGNTSSTLVSAIQDSSEPALAVHQHTTSQTPVAHHASNQKNKHTAAALKMGRIRLASPLLTFQSLSSSALDDEPCKIECFPLVDRKMIWADHLGRPFLFDAETRHVEILPNYYKTKSMPISLVVPYADADGDYDYALYIMEGITKPEANCSTHLSDQFEVFFHHKLSTINYFKCWQYEFLPPPPYIREPEYWECCSHHEISSYAAVGFGNSFCICISVKGIGTFFLDTAAGNTWRKVGTWTLPFHGRAEYVPELKLWFGLTEEDGHLAAADLSSIGPLPQLVGCWNWKQLYIPPEEWKKCKDPQLVNLGSGRFCITRFFHAGDVDENIAVFIGVEVVPLVQDANACTGEVKLHMIPHRSLCHKSTGVTIDAVF